MAPYEPEFDQGEAVRIRSADTLREFQVRWNLHNPLTNEQLAFAGRNARVKWIGFYHGGDVLYELHDVPGVWHECCLRASS